MKDPSHQLDLIVGGTSEPKPRRITRKQNRAPPVVEQPALTFPKGQAERKRRVELPVLPPLDFRPRAGVPATRGECPTEKPCPHVRCRYHLWRVDAEDRAGRPGLASVPRDEQGRTLAIGGDVGVQRAGTTLRPEWLRLWRSCLMRVIRDDEGQIVETEPLQRTYETNAMWNWEGHHIGTWDYMRPALRTGQLLWVFDYAHDELVSMARWKGGDALTFTRPFGSSVVLLANLEYTAPSCALDLVDEHGAMSNEQVGRVHGRHRTLIARENRGAAIKVRARGGDLRDVVAK